MERNILELPGLQCKQKRFRTHKLILSNSRFSNNQIYSEYTHFELTLNYYLVYVVKLDSTWNGVMWLQGSLFLNLMFNLNVVCFSCDGSYSVRTTVIDDDGSGTIIRGSKYMFRFLIVQYFKVYFLNVYS